MTDAAELAREQKYFDKAWEARERQREELSRARDGAALQRGAQMAVQKAAKAHAATLGEPDEAVAYGRFDLDGQAYYIGKHAISDEQREKLVINWQTNFGALYEQATVTDPHGVERKRVFRTEHNEILSFEDLVFADLLERVAELSDTELIGINDSLLEELNVGRTGEMRDIVRTIQAAQSGLIRHSIESLLVVQGGPGTGKSAVALHRASWIIFNHSDTLSAEDILVIGPTDTFTNYIRQVLPGLGDRDVQQISLRRLGPQRSGRRDEPRETAALKGQAKMATLLKRALSSRIRFPGDESALTIGQGRSGTSVTRESVEAQLHRLRTSPTYVQGRAGMRAWLVRQVEEAQLERAPRSAPNVDATAVDNALERMWPQLTPQQFLQELLGSTARLTEAAGDEFTAGDIRRLYRQSAQRLASEIWADSDVALLDEAEELIRGGITTFAHIIVDEAQDLSPMQLRSIRRRSRNGSYTVVGDIAQSTGPWTRNSWDDVIEALRQDYVEKIGVLELGYRVPKEVFEFAAELLPVIAPGITAPRVVRPAPEPPRFVATNAEELLGETVIAIREHAGKGRFVGVVVAPEHHDHVARALTADEVHFSDADTGHLGAAVNLVSASEAKGLEFDAVVVVEPAAIAAIDASGLRLLYIALTRTTKYLTVIHARAFAPLALEGTSDEEPSEETSTVNLFDVPAVLATPFEREPLTDQALPPGKPSATSQQSENGQPKPRLSPMLRGATAAMAEEIRAGISPQFWPAVLDELRHILGLDDETRGTP